MAVESETLHFGDSPEAPAAREKMPPPENGVLTVRYRLPPTGEVIEERQFILKQRGPMERRDIALTASRLGAANNWGSLPYDFRAWADSLATVIVMFRGQPDHDWLVAQCEKHGALLAHVAEEVEKFWAASFPDEYVVVQGETSTAVPVVEVTAVQSRDPSTVAAARPKVRPGAATIR